MSYNIESRQRQSELTRQKIYKSATTLFTERDYSQVSVESIVKLAGVSKGSFYVHFASKEAIIAEIIKAYVDDADEDYRMIAEQMPSSSSAFDTIMTVLARIIDVLSNKVGCDKMRALYRAQLSHDFNSVSVFGDDRKLYTLFKDIISKGIETDEFRNDIDAAILAKHIVIAMRGLTFEWCLKNGDFDYLGQTNSFFGTLLNGMRNPTKKI